MATLGEGVALSDGGNSLDWLWLGHAHQLAGRWDQAGNVRQANQVVLVLRPIIRA